MKIISGRPIDEPINYVSILSEKTAKPVSLLKSSSFQSKSVGDGQRFRRYGSILAYDDGCCYSAVTEQYALSQAVKLLPQVPCVIYFGFPWTTLIKLFNAKHSSADRLKEILDNAKFLIKEQKFVITVCQHIHMLRYQHVFSDIGITHVFWAHAIKGQNCFPKYRDIKILPFPLLPVHAIDGAASGGEEKKYLYSFVGGRSNEWCLTQSRNMIVDHLTRGKRRLVYSADQQRLKGAVSDHGIQSQTEAEQENMECFASKSVRKIIKESTFTLCPSGLGPNSTRLWGSIGYGSIPVILSDTYLPPGNQTLWQEATVSCTERLEEILALPDRLKTIEREPALLRRKRHALRQLWFLYGPGCFIFDIQKLFLYLAQENSDLEHSQPRLSYGRLLALAASINQAENVLESECDLFILGCISRVLSDSTVFINHYKKNAEFRMAYKKAISFCDQRHSEAILRNLEIKDIFLR